MHRGAGSQQGAGALLAKDVYRPRRLPRDFLTALTSRIPNRGGHLVRCYAYYSSMQRGRRRSQGREKMPLGPVLN